MRSDGLTVDQVRDYDPPRGWHHMMAHGDAPGPVGITEGTYRWRADEVERACVHGWDGPPWVRATAGAWRRWGRAQGLPVRDEATRDDIIELLCRAGVIRCDQPGHYERTTA